MVMKIMDSEKRERKTRNKKKKESCGTTVDIRGFPMVPHMLGLVAGFMHFLPLTFKGSLKESPARKELKLRRWYAAAYNGEKSMPKTKRNKNKNAIMKTQNENENQSQNMMLKLIPNVTVYM